MFYTKSLFLIIIIILLGLSSCNPKLKLVGTWRVKGRTVLMTPKMVIGKDGQLEMTYAGTPYSSQWMYDDDLKTFIVLLGDFKNEPQKAIVYKVTWKDAKRLEFTNAEETFELYQTKELNLSPANIKELILGTWQLKMLNGEQTTMFTLYLKPNGVAERAKEGRKSVTSWTISEDGKKLSLVDANRTEEMDLIVENKNTMEFIDSRGNSFVFKRKEIKDVAKLKKQLVGNWKTEEGEIFIIGADGTMSIEGKDEINDPITWSVNEDGDYLVLTAKDGSDDYLFFEFIDKNTLEIIDLKPLRLTRVK